MKFKLVFLLIIAVCCSSISNAQELRVKSFVKSDFDLSASVLGKERKDENGNSCALVKIQILDGVAKVEGNVIGDIEDNFVEKYVFISGGTKEIRIIPKHYKALVVHFSDFGIDEVEGKCTYILDLEERNDRIQVDKKVLEACKVALENEDWVTLERFAKEGIPQTYYPLAKHYFKLNDYDLADSYAQKSYQAKENMEKSKLLMQVLEKLGYYDDREVPQVIRKK